MAKPKQFASISPHHKLWLLTLAQADFGSAEAAARSALLRKGELVEGQRHVEYDALAECAIVRYARPFMRCYLPQHRDAGAPCPPQLSTQLPESFLEETLLPGAITVHRAAMKLRDQFYAHSDVQVKSIKFEVVERDGIVLLRTAGFVKRVEPKNLELLRNLAESLVMSLQFHIVPLVEVLLPLLRIGQTATIQFVDG